MTRAAERRQLILQAIRGGDGSVHELSARFRVSASTIRRDLERLGAEGTIARTYGGAVGGVSHLERSFDERAGHRQAEKEAIAVAAEGLVAEGDVLILDAGSTIGRLASRLKHREGLTVITNGLNTLATLADAPAVSVIVLGGELRALNRAILGPLAEIALQRLRADRAFISGSAVHPVRGLGAPTLAHAHLKTAMMACAREVVVLADHSKLDRAPAQFWTPLDRPWMLLTDAGADPAVRARFEAVVEATVLVADPDSYHDQQETTA